MKICMTCKVGLKVETNGVVVTYQGDTYTGDLFKCPVCKTEILAGMGQAHFDPDKEYYNRMPEKFRLGEVDVN